MNNYPVTFLYSLRFLFVGILLAAGLFLLSIVLSSIQITSTKTKDTDTAASTSVVSMSNNPNVVTSGMATAGNELAQATDSTVRAVNSGIKVASSAVGRTGKLVGRSLQTGVIATVRGVGSGLAFMGRTIGKGFGLLFSIPGNILNSVSNTSVMRAVIRPADHVEVPIINPDSHELHAALTALPPTNAAPAPQNNPGPAWPMRGEITTEFGVAHWPYQHTHTGLDISDRQSPGTTPIKPFRPGRVIESIRSNRGLGNHVIVDHGSGVTSVYAHLASISVQVGQEVVLDTTLGLEGTSGVSTGTHLHFEIRVHGQAADPRKFISGQP